MFCQQVGICCPRLSLPTQHDKPEPCSSCSGKRDQKLRLIRERWMLRFTRASIAIAYVLATTNAFAANLQPGEIDGWVNDAIGQALPSVSIVAQDQHGKVLASTHSDAGGHFHFSHLAAGVYAIIATKADFQTGTDIVMLDQAGGKSSHITLASQKALSVHVQANKITRARNEISTDNGGSSTYHISSADINAMPQGADTPFNQVLLQAPGVVQDSFGQVHVRGEHADLQYRINGILLPESISGFGQTLDSRFIDSVNLVTGALSAEYGLRTAGIVDIHTKTGALDQGGNVDIMGGDRNTGQLSANVSGHKDNFSYYLEASSLQNNLGIENPMPTANAIHDASVQNTAFGYFSWTLNDSLRASAMFGVADDRFQIPDIIGQTPQYTLAGVNNYPSQNLNEQQHETTQYGLFALQGTAGSAFDYQLSAFSRYSRVAFSPDVPGDLIYTGVASQVLRTALENGLEADTTWHLNAAHTIRSGLFVSSEQAVSNSDFLTFTANSAGAQTSTTPIALTNSNSLPMQLFGVYAEDEWKLTDKLTIDDGLRFDQVSGYVTGHQMSPRLSAIYQWTPQTVAHAGYAHYFTPPPDELISNQAVNSVQGTTNAQPGGTLNSPIKPESSDYFDVGIDHHLTQNLTAGLDSYYKYVTNLLDEGQFGSALLYTPFNYAQGKVYGEEFTLNYRQDNFSSYFNLAHSTALGKGIESAQYNFSPAELNYIANNWVHLDHDQTWTASSGLAYTLHQMTYTADLIYGSGLRNGFANTSHLSGYTQVNVAAMRHIVLPAWGSAEVRLIVLNLFDSSYEIRDGTGIGVGAPQYGPRRAVMTEFSKPF